jgi:aminoglycoside/choline kinase family phosphotransferase
MAEQERERLIAAFLERHGWGAAARRKLAGDASFRRYERLARNGERAVLMDAPPPQEDVRPFIQVDRLLRSVGLTAPEIHAADEQAGLLLLQDFGDDTYTRLIARGHDERELYELAVDVLIRLHKALSPAALEALPRFEDGRCIEEAMRLMEWYWPAAHGSPAPGDATQSFVDAWRAVLPAARRIPDGLTIYDFHVDNLMLLPAAAGTGIERIGLLDFQDAMRAPVSFDLMSLLQDVRRDIAGALAAQCYERYLAAFPALDREDFAASYAVMGAQRNIRILGTFVRLWLRDGKPGYLNWLPRTWRFVECDLAHPALAPLRAWFDRHLPAATRGIPAGLREVAQRAREASKAMAV